LEDSLFGEDLKDQPDIFVAPYVELLNWDKIDLDVFCRMVEDGTKNIFSLFKFIFSEVEDHNFKLNEWKSVCVVMVNCKKW
jgi:hypothetical protein